MKYQPAAQLIAIAIPHGPGFLSEYALPGMLPVIVSDPDTGDPVMHMDRKCAEGAARDAVLEAYRRRISDTRKNCGYVRMTGAEMAALLAHLMLDTEEAAEIIGVPQARVVKWIDGEQDIPHSVNLLLRLLSLNVACLELARAITKESTAG